MGEELTSRGHAAFSASLSNAEGPETPSRLYLQRRFRIWRWATLVPLRSSFILLLTTIEFSGAWQLVSSLSTNVAAEVDSSLINGGES